MKKQRTRDRVIGDGHGGQVRELGAMRDPPADDVDVGNVFAGCCQEFVELVCRTLRSRGLREESVEHVGGLGHRSVSMFLSQLFDDAPGSAS